MEILQTLRNHINEDLLSSFPDREIFSNILENIEKQLLTSLRCENNELHDDQYVTRCIDLEGLDGCGKSTLANKLQQQLNLQGQKSRLLSTPPQQLLPFRSYFDRQTETIRRAYYNLGNLIISFELKRHPDTITILDRYWPSTIAYQLAKQGEIDQIKISWPNYLVQPALIVYIYVDEEERRRRIDQRSVPITLEEKQLVAQEAFRCRLDYIYRNHIPTSSCLHVIDGNQPTSIIAKEVLEIFQEKYA